MNATDIKLRKKGLTRKYLSESLKKLHNSWQLCKDFREFDATCKELRINRVLTNSEELKFREDRRAQGKTINSLNYTKNQKLQMTSLEECIKTQESLKNELLREKMELIKEISEYQANMDLCHSFNNRSPKHINDVMMYHSTYSMIR